MSQQTNRSSEERALSKHILPSSGTMIGVCATLIGLVKLAEAHIGHDKLGSASAIVARSADVTTFRLVRGRPESSSPGDERAIVASGRVSVLRHGWRSGTPVGAPVVDAWNHALR